MPATTPAESARLRRPSSFSASAATQAASTPGATITRRLVAAGAACAAVLLAACGSTGASSSRIAREGGLVALTMGGQTLTIISDAYLERSGVPGDTDQERRNAFYSVARENALVKVAGDERFGDLVRALEASGFSEHAAEGEYAGSSGSAVSLVVGDEARHTVQPTAATAAGIAALDKKRLEAFANMKGAIVIVYNEIRAFQNVNADDVEFEQPELAPNLRRFVKPLAR